MSRATRATVATRRRRLSRRLLFLTRSRIFPSSLKDLAVPSVPVREALAMNGFHCVYLLESSNSPGTFYVGLTNHLRDRLRRHNAGLIAHTRQQRPWQIRAAIAFRDRPVAAAFERYLKSGSGRAFAKRHL